MSPWQITKPPPRPKTLPKLHRPARNVRLCACGQPAVAIATVRVGLDGCYTVILYLCPTCLAIEQESDTIPPPISIIYLI